MKRGLRRALLGAAFLLASFAEAGAQGGRDLSVALFTTHIVHSLTLTPLSSNAWTARCASCSHVALTAPLAFGRGELFAGGALRLSDGIGGQREATGLWHIKAEHDGIDTVLTLPSERYVEAVLNAEAAPDEPPASLAALAIVVRTYALNGPHPQPSLGHLGADLCDSTACQAVRFAPASSNIHAAVRETAGETLWFHGSPAQTFFSQSCGGQTEDAEAVWPAMPHLPYLFHHADPYCVRTGRAAWHTELTLGELAEVSHAEGWTIPPTITVAEVATRSASGRATRILLRGSRGEQASIAAGALRLGIGRALGWSRVRSDLYSLGLRHGALVFDGQGHGHGVGLCQQGAAVMALQGKPTAEILRFYFPGTQVGITPLDTGWHTEHVGALTLRYVHPLAPGQRADLLKARSEAEQRLPSPQVTEAGEITFAPSVELFRQLTNQPGWMLASTAGNSTVLQPLDKVRAQGEALEALLLHEILHQRIEAQANPASPLWLREGLVEVLTANPAPMGASPLKGAALEAELKHSSSWEGSLRAHRAAGARVQLLVQRYGLAAALTWLRQGVPAGIS